MVYLLKMVHLSMANCECHNQMVYLVDVERMPPFLSTWEGDQHGAMVILVSGRNHQYVQYEQN